MAKSKYSPETVTLILDAIRERGGDEDGWLAGQISRTTFYEWQNQHPDFQKGVAIAKREYQESLPAVQRRQARRAFNDYLFGRIEEVWESEEQTFEANGDLTIKRTIKKVRRGPAVWAIERVLGRNLDILEAIKTMIESGLAPEQLIEVTERRIAEAKAQIKQDFINPQP